MKKIILIPALAFCCSLNGQTSLTQSFNEPKAGEVENVYGLDTSDFSSGMPLGVKGANVVWDYTKLKAIAPSFGNNYLSPSSTTASANYPGCTFVQESGFIYSYFKSVSTPTTQTEFLGVQMTTLSINLTNSGIVARYPMAFGYNLSDNLSGSFTASISGTCSGNIVTSADGTGTLNLPNGFSFSDVLRVKSVQNITLTAVIFPVGVLKQTVYRYYHSSQKFPLLSISYLDFASSLVGSFSDAYATGSINSFIVGIGENGLPDNAVRVYPNPVLNNLSIDLNSELSDAQVTIYNQLGQAVLETRELKNISLITLQSGIYILELNTSQGSFRKKIVKE